MSKITYSGIGSVFMAPVSSAGVIEDGKGYYKVGDAHPLSVQVTTSTKKHQSREVDRAGQIIASKTIIEDIVGSLTLHQWSAQNLAWALAGDYEAEAVTGDTVTDEEIDAVHDEYVRLDYAEISAVTVQRKLGVDATTWAVSTAYTSASYVIPTTPNGRFYHCTTAGTSHAATEPTWPTTKGATVTDGTATWTDMGLITPVVTTDYVVQANLGMIQALSTGQITDGETLEVDYTYATKSNYKVNIGTESLLRVAILADLEDEYTGESMTLELKSVVLNTTAEMNFISEQDSDHETLAFGLTIETPTGETSPGTVNGVPL